MAKDKKIEFEGTLDGNRIATKYHVHGRSNQDPGRVSLNIMLDTDYDPEVYKTPVEAIKDVLKGMAEHWKQL